MTTNLVPNVKIIYEQQLLECEFNQTEIISCGNTKSRYQELIGQGLARREPISHSILKISDSFVMGGWGFIAGLEDRYSGCIGWGEKNRRGIELKASNGAFGNEIKYIEGTYIFVSFPGIYTWGHWLNDILPRIFLVYKACDIKNIELLLPNNLHKNMYALLDLLCIRYKKYPSEGLCWVESLIVPSMTSKKLCYPYDFHVECYKFFRNKIIYSECKNLNALYIKHKTMTSILAPRVLANEFEMLNNLGNTIDVIDPSSMSLIDQINVFNSSKLVFGLDSSALHGVVFSKSGTTQLVMCDRSRINPIHYNLSCLNNTKLYVLEQSTNNGNINVDVDILGGFLNNFSDHKYDYK